MVWWSMEVQDEVRAKKIAYKRLLSQQTKETKLAYNEAKKEAKCRVRKAKNEEWIRLGRKWKGRPEECTGGSGHG